MLRIQFTVILCLLAATNMWSQPIVPGFVVDVYASVNDPTDLSFDSNGNLYVGRDNTGSGGSFLDDVKIHRIGTDQSVTEWGLTTITDPDTVIVDVSGSITGTPNSVLVGGFSSNNVSRVSVIAPDQTISTLFTTTNFQNISGLAISSSDTLLIQGLAPARLMESTGGAPILLTGQNGVGRTISTDGSGLLYASVGSSGMNDGVIRIYDEAGVEIENAYLTGLDGFRNNFTYIDSAVWGTGLLGVHGNGDLTLYDATKTPIVLGTGFDQVQDIVEGPNGSLYLSEFGNDRVIVVNIPEPASLSFFAAATLLFVRLRQL